MPLATDESQVIIPPEVVQEIESFAKKIGGCSVVNHAVLVTEMLNKEYAPLMRYMIDTLHQDRRPTLMLHKGDHKMAVPTVWLLGWSTFEGTDIHDHKTSCAGISVVRGEVSDKLYLTMPGADFVATAQQDEGLFALSSERGLREGSTITVPSPYIHEMFGHSRIKEQKDITVHAYWPPLESMNYFKRVDGKEDKLFYAGTWNVDGEYDGEREYCRFCPREVK